MKSLFVSCLLSALTITSFAAPQFSPQQTITTGFHLLYGMAVADFNGDGKPDIAAVDNSVKKIFIYLNDGKGSFGTPKSMDLNMAALGPGQIIAADFNEDGKQDLIIATVAGSQSDLLLLGNGDGTFAQQPDLPNSFGFSAGVPVDINRDHHLDLILGGNGSMGLYLGDGRGGFQEQSFPNQGTSSLFTGLAVADVNNDGKIDFAVASPFGSPGVRVFLGNGDGTFTFSNTISTTVTVSGPASVGIADFDGDGNQDILIGSTSVATVVPGKGDGTFDTSIKYFLATGGRPVNQKPYSDYVLVSDVDGDQKPDAIITDDSDETVNVSLNSTINALRNRPNGPYTNADIDFNAPMDQGVYLMSVSDLNGDGLPDIVLGSNVTQNISVYLSIKPRAAATVAITPSVNPQLVGSSVTFTAKITGIGSNIPTGTVTLLDGTTSLGQQTLDANAQATFSLSNLTAGQHSITVSYSGDNNFLPATSSALTQSIADFQVALPTASQAVTAGGNATYNLTITPAGGLTGSISITCSQLPSLASCAPVTVPVTGQPATATLTVQTTTAFTTRGRSPIRTASLGLLAVAFTALLSLRTRRPIQLLVVTVALMLSGSSVGCSGGSTKSTTTTPGTPQGTTQFTITSSVTLGGQTLARTSTATLVVQ